MPKFPQAYGVLVSGHDGTQRFLGSFAANGLCPATDGSGRCGFINTSGSFAISLQFFRVDNFSDSGYAAVENTEYKWGFIDRTGTMVLSANYDDVGSFSTFTIRA